MKKVNKISLSVLLLGSASIESIDSGRAQTAAGLRSKVHHHYQHANAAVVHAANAGRYVGSADSDDMSGMYIGSARASDAEQINVRRSRVFLPSYERLPVFYPFQAGPTSSTTRW